MSEPDHAAGAADAAAPSPDFAAQIASLRSLGAHRFDPVRLRYLEALYGRAAAHGGSVRRVLDERLAQALTAFEERFALAQGDARQILRQGEQQYPHAGNDLQRLFDGGEFEQLRRMIAALQSRAPCGPLGALVRQLEQQSPEQGGARTAENIAAHSELKAVREFRNTWSKLSVDKQVAQALEQAPKNAGPINSHLLVLRSLALMRDLSPDYLNRFMSYAETLLCLDQGDKRKAANPRIGNPKKPAGKAAKK